MRAPGPAPPEPDGPPRRPATLSRIRASLLTAALAAVLIAAGAFPESGPATKSDGPAAATAGKAKKQRFVRRMERGIRKCANSRRRRAGRKPLNVGAKLGDAARFHAQKMAKGGFFSHIDPQGRGPDDRVRMFGAGGTFAAVGENIAAGQSGPAGACRAWMGSSGHRHNILGGFTHIGGGFAPGGPYGRYYVMVLGRIRG